MNRAAAMACGLALTACRHGAPPPEAADPLWRRAELVVGRGDGHLPLPARVLVAIDRRRALALYDGGGLAEIDLLRGAPTRHRDDALDGDALAATRLPDGRVLAVGARAARERAWWIDADHLTARGVDVPGAAGGDAVFAASGVASSGDGHLIAITGVRLPLALRDPRDLSVVRELSPERNWSHPVFVADAYLVASHHDEVIAYDLATGRSAGRWPSSTGFASPDGLVLMHPPDLIHLELTDLHNPDFKVALSSQDPIDVAWAPDGEHVVVVDPDRVIAYAIPSGDRQAIALPGALSRGVFSTDGQQLVVTAAGALWRVDPSTGRLVGPTGPGAGRVAFVAPIAGGVVMQSDRWRVVDRGGVRASGNWRGVAIARGGGGFALSPDGSRVVATSVGGDEAFVEEWDAATGRSLVSAVSDDALVAVDVGDDGAIVAALPDGIERLRADRAVETLAPPRWAPPVDLVATADRAVYGRAGAIAVTDLHAGPAIARAVAFDCDGDAAARLSRDGRRLVVIAGARVAVWSIGDGAAATPVTARLPGPVRAIAVGRHGVIAAVGDRLVLWDPDAGRAAALTTPAAVTAIGLDAAGDRIALGFGDGRAGVWAAADLRALAAPLTLGDAGALPASCPGDPLAPIAPADEPGAGPPDPRPTAHHHLQPLAQP